MRAAFSRTECARSSVRTIRGSRFAAKLIDFVGLYVHPPSQAVVLSFDEKSQIQVLDRTNPPLPSHRLRRRKFWQLRPDCRSSARAAAR